MKTLQANNQSIKSLVGDGQTSSQQPGGRWFKSNPRYQFSKPKSSKSGKNTGVVLFFTNRLLT